MRVKFLIFGVVALIAGALIQHHNGAARTTRANQPSRELFPKEFGETSPEVLGAMLFEHAQGKLSRAELWGTARNLADQRRESDKWIGRVVDGYHWEADHPLRNRIPFYSDASKKGSELE